MSAVVCWRYLASRDGIYGMPSSGRNDSSTARPVHIDNYARPDPDPAIALYLVQPTRWRHGSLDRQAADVLPTFLQQ